MKSPTEPAFTVIDRRGQNRVEEEKPLAHVAQAATAREVKAELVWKGTAYLLALAQSQQGMLLIGKVAGLRGDGRSFSADYLIFQILPDLSEPLPDWRPIAKKRLDTFLGCDCSIAHGACHIHKMYLAQWQKEDMARIQMLHNQPVPEALEMLHRAETAARHPHIVVPR